MLRSVKVIMPPDIKSIGFYAPEVYVYGSSAKHGAYKHIMVWYLYLRCDSLDFSLLLLLLGAQTALQALRYQTSTTMCEPKQRSAAVERQPGRGAQMCVKKAKFARACRCARVGVVS